MEHRAPASSVGRLRAVYRLPAGAEVAASRARLDGVLADLVDAGWDDGWAGDALVCIRRLRVDLRLSLRLGDAALAAAWRGAIGRAVQDAAAGADRAPRGDAEVLRYRSLAHARRDLAQSLARGALARRWAWVQVGLWPSRAGATVEAGLAALLAAWGEAPHAVPIELAELADTAGGAALLARVPTRGWVLLARAVGDAHGVDRTDVADLARAPSAGAGSDREASATGVAAAAAHRPGAVSRSVFGASTALSTLFRTVVRRDAAARAPLAALLVLSAEPGLARRDRATRAAWLAAALRTLDFAQRDDTDVAPVLPSPATHTTDTMRSAAPAHAPTGVPVLPHAPADGMVAATTPRHPDHAPPRTADDLPAPLAADPRRCAATACGGLPFLLHLVPSSGLLDATGALAARPLRWLLHRLAGLLVPSLADDDPARRAFCGLGPDRPSPALDQPPATHAEDDALQGAAARLCAALRERLVADPAVDAAALVAGVVQRPAEVRADPGWIDIAFPADAADTTLRRAGLDRDPDWLPWLGVVLRFHYG